MWCLEEGCTLMLYAGVSNIRSWFPHIMGTVLPSLSCCLAALPTSLGVNILLLSPCRIQLRQCNCTTGGMRATEGHKAHGHHIGPKQADYNTQFVTGHVERLPAAGHTIVLSFSSTLTGTVRLFCSYSNEDKHLALCKHS